MSETNPILIDATFEVEQNLEVDIKSAEVIHIAEPLKGYIERTATTIDDDILEEIGEYGFYHYSTLTSARFNKVQSIYPNAFEYCQWLTSADFPELLEAGDFIFRNCSRLKTVNMPKVEYLGEQIFISSGLTSIILPKIEDMKNTFMGSTYLTLADLGESFTAFMYGDFYGCSSFNKLILRCPTMVTMETTRVLQQTPFMNANYAATLYVPQALISEYEADEQWAKVLAYRYTTIKAIEGSPYESQ